MRPVIVVAPNPAHYPVFNAAAENALVPNFNAGSAMAIVYNHAGGFQRSIAWVQNQLLDKAVLHNAFPNPSTPLNRARARRRMRKRLEVIYRQSRMPMVAMLGDYCSFCGLPLAGFLLATEHRAAKEPYPTYTTWWWNFLLACRDCNSVKGTTPSRATTLGWSGVPAPTEPQRIQAIQDNYYWPDVDHNTYRNIRDSFWMDTQAAMPVRLNGNEFSSRHNRLVSHTMTVVRANVRHAGALRANRYIESQIYNRNPDVAGGRTIVLTGLDDQETARSALRTRAWMSLCLQRDIILTGVANAPGNEPAAFTMGWHLMLLVMVMTGFYSTAVRVLSKRGFPANVPAGLYANLGEKFVFDTLAANAPFPPMAFPGTDAAQVP